MRVDNTVSKSPHEAVAAEVRAEMARQQISQHALAGQLGWPQARLSRRMTGTVPLDIAELVALAAALDVPVTQFLPTPARTS